MFKINVLEYKLKSMTENELNEILDLRDSSLFEKEMIRLYEQLKNVDVEFDGEERFIRLSNATNCHEACSYIIEDFELIEKALSVNYENLLLNHLIESYKKGMIPHNVPKT